ncbi:MAG: cell division protein ZipA [Gammaproteobacteria bacterium]|nr:cell division protein ZipA [Gammaproteobacteria bacterium]
MTNWSLILNVLLLIGVVFALMQMVKAKHREKVRHRMQRAEVSRSELQQDEVIAVRRLKTEDSPACDLEEKPTPISSFSTEPSIGEPVPTVSQDVVQNDIPKEEMKVKEERPVSLMLFLLAKDDRQLAGYDLLQTILAAGLRFGEGQLFHRHQHMSGQGPIICSLATATASGVFDLQNMGAFSVRGLCLFMEASGNPSIDAERLTIMLDTAKQLSEGLDTHLLDDEQTPWSDRSLARYHKLLDIPSEEALYLD